MRLMHTIAILSILAAPAAFADSIDIHNTGAGGAAIGDADPNYILFNAPAGTSSPTATVSTANGAWVQNTATTQWIDPSGSGNAGEPVGTFVYVTSFTLGPGEDPATAILNLNIAADNLFSVSLNGHSDFGPGGNFNVLTPVTISSGFMAGNNVLEFDVDNQGGPTGLFVEASGTVSPSVSAVPEPGSITLLGTGLLSVVGLTRRRFVRS
jgi:PEP-CTERM motif